MDSSATYIFPTARNAAKDAAKDVAKEQESRPSAPAPAEKIVRMASTGWGLLKAFARAVGKFPDIVQPQRDLGPRRHKN